MKKKIAILTSAGSIAADDNSFLYLTERMRVGAFYHWRIIKFFISASLHKTRTGFSLMHLNLFVISIRYGLSALSMIDGDNL